MNEQTEVQEVEATAQEAPQVPVILENDGLMLTQGFVDKAGKQIELRAQLIRTALKAVRPHDFQDFDGKPYLEGEGAARIMAVVRGFKVGEAKFNIEQIFPHYFIECQIPIEFMGATTVALGDCSTADPFFCGKAGDGGIFKRHLDRTGSDAMAARLVLGDAKKKARENALSRGVSELLGLKGLSWKDLEQLGFKRTEAGASIQFDSPPSEAIECSKCGKVINKSVFDYSIKYFNASLCRDCQPKKTAVNGGAK
jgi:hypothetical protein